MPFSLWEVDDAGLDAATNLYFHATGIWDFVINPMPCAFFLNRNRSSCILDRLDSIILNLSPSGSDHLRDIRLNVAWYGTRIGFSFFGFPTNRRLISYLDQTCLREFGLRLYCICSRVSLLVKASHNYEKKKRVHSTKMRLRRSIFLYQHPIQFKPTFKRRSSKAWVKCWIYLECTIVIGSTPRGQVSILWDQNTR